MSLLNTNGSTAHSSLGNDGSAGGPSHTAEQAANVHFSLAPTTEYDEMAPIDYTRDIQTPSDNTSLDEFFMRPIKIASSSWAINTSYFQNINVWELYWNNPRVSNKICCYQLLRCRMHVKIVLNGNPFYYGRILASYLPLHNLDGMYRNSPFFEHDLVSASQLPSCYVSPTTNVGAEMELPLLWPKNVLDVPAAEWTEMGQLNLRSVSTLRSTADTITPVNVAVFAWATEVKFGGLTSVKPSGLLPQADEFGVKPVSRISTSIATAAGYFTKLPVIGSYAKATEIGFNAISAIANLFGFSKPTILNTTVVSRKAKINLANNNAEDESHKLSLDLKQEVSIDPRIVGAPPYDPLAIVNIVTRPSYYKTTIWSKDYPEETMIFNMVVDPCVTRANSGGSGEFTLPPCAFGTFPFKYWRGSMKYTVDIVCSAFHKGRIKLGHEPSGLTSSAYATYNANKSMICDISESTSFEFIVPWCQSTSFRRHLPFGTLENKMFSDVFNDPIAYSNSSGYGNGLFYISVVTALTAPTTGFGEDVEIIISVSACDDFEVACPSQYDLMRMRYTPDPNYVPETPELEPQAEILSFLEPQAEVINSATRPMVKQEPALSINDDSSLVFFGESVRSYRQLLKRFTLIEYVPLNDQETVSGLTLSKVVRPILPLDGGYIGEPTTIQTQMPVYQAALGKYVYANMNYLDYFSHAYLGWRGAVRYIVDTSRASCCTISNIISRSPLIRYPLQLYEHPGSICVVCNPTPINDLNIYADFGGEEHMGFTGSSISTNSIDSVTTVELPYYSDLRFFPSRHITRYEKASGYTYPFTVPDQYWSILFSGREVPNDTNVALWAAGGEDFSPFFFLGSPRMYYQSFFP